MRWLTTQKRKKQQRALNKAVRAINNSIEDSIIWQGRFYIYQIATQWYGSNDKNYCNELFVCLKFVDRFSGKSRCEWRTVNEWISNNSFCLYRSLNNFVTHHTLNIYNSEYIKRDKHGICYY